MSEKTLAAKPQIKATTALRVSHRERAGLIGELPAGAALVADAAAATVAVGFVDDEAGARALLDSHGRALAREGVTIWLCYPNANRTDINRDTLWKIVGAYGLRPNGVAALDETWSAMRYRALAPGESCKGFGAV